jgi:hypothetical protein
MLTIAREASGGGPRECLVSYGWQAYDWVVRQVRGSPICRPKPDEKADVAQSAERVLGKDEVTSSILVIGSILRSPDAGEGCPP